MTSFMLFSQEVREAERAKGTKHVDILRIAGSRWKALSKGDMKKYEDLALPGQKEYAKEMKNYESSGKKDAWKRDPAMPKRPLSGYMHFVAEWRSKNNTDTLKVSEVAKHAASAWKALTPQQQEVYNKKYQTQKASYDKEMASYKSSGKLDQWKEKVGIADVERKAEQKKQKELDAKKRLREKQLAAKQKKKSQELAAKQKAKDIQVRKRAKEVAARRKMKEMEAKAKTSAQKKAKIEAQKHKTLKQTLKAKELKQKKAVEDKLKAMHQKVKDEMAKLQKALKNAKKMRV
jgi:hypothetical protein